MNEKRQDYLKRLDLLREKKAQQTEEKIAKYGFVDEDDYGSVVPPEDFSWEPVFNHPSGLLFWGARGWAENFLSLMEAHPLYVDPLDALAGRWMILLQRTRKVEMNPDFDYSHLHEEQKRYSIIHGIGKMHHFAKDLRIGLELGWGGLLEKVRRYRSYHHCSEKEEFFQAEETVILAVQIWIRRITEEIRRKLAEEESPSLRENLEDMLAVSEWLVEGKPRTLREACQWIAWFNMASRIYDRDGAGGQLDELLRPYYERDKAEGRIDDEDAIYYIACLILNDSQYYQLGGPDPSGRDLTSHISFLILEAAHRMGVTTNLTIRVHENLDQELFRLSLRYLFEDKKGWPRYSGDRALVEGFMRNGYSRELAVDRIAVGCHWMSIPGQEYTLNDTVKINVAKVFEVAFWEMMEGEEEPSLEGLWGRYQDHLERAVACTAQGIDFHLRHQSRNAPELLLNLLCHGPIERGLDVSAGGVDFYNMCVDGAGLATVADSFAALEEVVCINGRADWKAVARALREDFSSPEGQRLRMLFKKSSKYGRGGSVGDEWAVKVSQQFTETVKKGPTPDGYNMIPGWFSWANTVELGRVVGATPNGRRAGAPISHGANPDPGFRVDGALTAMAKAIAQIQPGYGNTAPMQVELDPRLGVEDGGLEKVEALIRGHFNLGGTLININILDGEKLRRAHRDPQAYPDLIVRVTGFTAYFALLSPEFRQLVVDRVISE
jgi:pyruvate-formate lyase